MTKKTLLVRFAITASAACAPLWAQTPLFTDGTAFGGSKVFSEGMNPLGNPARTSTAPSGWYFTWAGGDQEAKDFESNLSAASSADPNAATAALMGLANSPWGMRTQAFGIETIKKAACLGLTREEFNGILDTPDLNPADLGSGVAANTSTLTGIRAVVDRLSVGGGGPLKSGSTTALGVGLRIERWGENQITETYNVAGPGLPAFGSAEADLLDGHATAVHSWNLGLDAGIVLELAKGVRLGLTGDQLVPRHLWGVDLGPQARAGLQLDLGQLAQLTLEGDLNSTDRMPFAARQQANAASLRLALGSSVVILLGAEQRKIDDVSVIRGGATLQIRGSSMLVAVGFQLGQDRPLKGATVMVN